MWSVVSRGFGRRDSRPSPRHVEPDDATRDGTDRSHDRGEQDVDGDGEEEGGEPFADAVDLGGDDDRKGERHRRHHRAQHRFLHDAAGTGAGRGELGQRGGGEREGDEQQERLDERLQVDGLDEGRADHGPQVDREQEHLGEHQQRGGREKSVSRTAGEAGEHDHVVHARGQQNEEHPDQQYLVGGDDPRQHEDHDRDEDEVDDERGGQEPPVAERLPDPRERHTEERRIPQDPEHGG